MEDITVLGLGDLVILMELKVWVRVGRCALYIVAKTLIG